jgi:hypothetical protein
MIAALEKEKDNHAKIAITENRDLTKDKKDKILENNKHLAILYNHKICAELVITIVQRHSPNKSIDEVIEENLSSIKSDLKDYMTKEAMKTKELLDKSTHKLFKLVVDNLKQTEKNIKGVDTISKKLNEEIKQERTIDDLANKHIKSSKKEVKTTNNNYESSYLQSPVTPKTNNTNKSKHTTRTPTSR